MALRSYRDLTSGSRYLRGVAFNAGASNLRDGEREEAEHQATVEIDAALATSFTSGAAPAIVRLLGDLLGSAIVLEWLALQSNFGEDGEGARKPSYLRSKAKAILEDLRAHKIGIQNDDGTWNALYPQPGVLPTIEVGAAKQITIDPGLTWGQMAQPVISQAEANALDPERVRRSTEAEAAYAGAYGV